MQPEQFLTATLRKHPEVTRILAAALHAVEPGEAVRRFLRREGNKLRVAEQVYDLEKVDRVAILGVGKAARGMTGPVAESLPERTHPNLLIPKHAFSPPWAGFNVIPGGHPVPTQASLQAGAAALELARSLTENDLLVCLISGGGSALMVSPRPGLTLDDLQTLTRQLLACGARVDEINTLRRHLDLVKGGGLAKAAHPAQVASLILSDVVSNALEAIASGPTAPDPSSRGDALGVLEKYGLTGKVPATILKVLENAPETPKPSEGWLARAQNVLVGSNALAAQAALQQAKAQGFQTESLGHAWQGEARLVAKTLCALWLRKFPDAPALWVAGGETTVVLKPGAGGLGGRNQELALAAVRLLAGQENALLVTLASDGEDGPTDAAGAVVDGSSLARAQALGLDPDDFLARNDSYHFFAALGDLLKPGPSGTNVNDLVFLFRLG